MKYSIVLRKNGDIDKNLNLFFKKKDLPAFQESPSSQGHHRVAPLSGRDTGLCILCDRWHQGAFTFNPSVFKSGYKERLFLTLRPRDLMERYFLGGKRNSRRGRRETGRLYCYSVGPIALIFASGWIRRAMVTKVSAKEGGEGLQTRSGSITCT